MRQSYAEARKTKIRKELSPLVQKVIIAGAGEQGRITADICRELDMDVIGFLDDTIGADTKIEGTPVLGGFELLQQGGFADDTAFLVAIGDAKARSRTYKLIDGLGLPLAQAIHPNCMISPSARIGRGVVICGFGYVAAGARIGDFTLLGARVTVGGDACIGKGVWLGPSCTVLGGVTVGDRAFIAAGAILTPGITVGARSIVGAGSVALADVPEDVLAVGSPARVVKDL